jgi:hypothetical protein
MAYVSDLLAALKSHPAAMAAVILMLMLSARLIGRLAFYTFVIAVAAGGFGFLGWMN